VKIAVYTSITAKKDSLKESQNFQGADFIAFTDIRKRRSRWEMRQPNTTFEDPNRNAKIHKILAHNYLPDYDYSLWIDGTVCLVQSAEEMIERYLGDSDIALFGHHSRTCTYIEAETCIQRKLDSPQVISEQVSRYREAGFPEQHGLYAGTVILRRHTAAVAAFNEMWWSEISRGSKRDQLSLCYVLWRLGMEPGKIPGSVYRSPSIVTWQNHSGLHLPGWFPRRAKNYLYRLRLAVSH
jgi:hypothetical protein